MMTFEDDEKCIKCQKTPHPADAELNAWEWFEDGHGVCPECLLKKYTQANIIKTIESALELGVELDPGALVKPIFRQRIIEYYRNRAGKAISYNSLEVHAITGFSLPCVRKSAVLDLIRDGILSRYKDNTFLLKWIGESNES